MSHNPTNLAELYSGDDLSALFKGGFINFGFWDKPHAANNKITVEDVVESNKRLYLEVFKRCDFNINDNVLEVGSGYGAGCILLQQHYAVKSLTGLDFFQSFIDLAIARYAEAISGDMIPCRFLQGRAEELPFPEASFDKIYTVDAFQHFHTEQTLAEFSRVLNKGGMLILANFFATDRKCFPELLELLPRPAVISDYGTEENTALPDILKEIEKHGFHDLKIEAIGENVWAGYDKWVKQTDPSIWDVNWLQAYERKLLDYYIITARR